jgi:hypothetical protein
MKALRYLPLAALPAVIYSFIVAVLNDDIHVFLGVARLADSFGSFPANIDMAWELKPIGNRLIFYLFYKLFQSVIGNEWLVQVGMKALVAIMGLAICAYFAVQVAGKLKGLDVIWIFTIAALAVFTVHDLCMLQSEFFALLLSILAIGLMLSEREYCQYLAGAVMLGVVLLKLITVVFIPLVLITWFLVEKHVMIRKWKRLFYGFIVATGVFIVSCILWFHNFVNDTLLLLSLGHPTNTGLIGQIGLLLIETPGILWFIPILIAGLIATVLIVKNRIGGWAWVMVSWVLALAIAFIQVEFWNYQYLPLVIPSITAIFLLMETRTDREKWIQLLAFVGITLMVWFIACSIWGVPHQSIWSGLERDRAEVQANYSSVLGQKVLYLDSGNAPYYIGAPSACRFISQRVIQRSGQFNPKLVSTDAYKDQMNCITSYSGEFIVMNTRWFGIHEPINSKVHDEYKEVYQGTFWNLYQRSG